MDDQSLQDFVKLRGKTRPCAFRVSKLQTTAPSTQEDSLPRPLLRGGGILSGAEALVEGLRYRPRTQATRATFDFILTIVAKNLGDMPQEIVRCAADATLEYLKDEHLKDFDKKKEIDDLLGVSLSPKEFNELVNLGKKITDYDAEDEATIP